MTETITLRPMRPEDTPQLCCLFHDAVQVGAADFYDAAQRDAWSPRPPDPMQWTIRLSGQTVIVAEVRGAVAGFMTLLEGGYLDLAFVAPALSGRGIGSRLLGAIETHARGRGMTVLTVQASLAARPLFERRGWRVVREQTVRPAGIEMTNFAMEKRLAPG